MKRTTLIVGAVAIAVASTAVVATAKDRGAGPRDGRGPAMMLEEFDTDADGAITLDEVRAAAALRFTEADTDGDGQLGAEEMAAAADARRAARQSARIAGRIARHDTDGDGMLSLGEVTAAAGSGRIEVLFERFDSDGDGAITQAELEEARGPMGRRGMGKRHGGNFWHK